MAFSRGNDVWQKICLCALALILQAGCASSSSIEKSQMKYADYARKELRHENGLMLRIADPLPVEQTPNGFRVLPHKPEELRVRGSAGVSVSLGEGEAQPQGAWAESPEWTYPEGEWSEQRIGSRVIHYREDKYDSGGSGGDEIKFRAWETVPNGHITYFRRYQRKYGARDFTLCWHVIEGTSLRAKE